MLKKMPRDPNTLSNYHELVTSRITANFTIDFQKKQLTGNVILALKSTRKGTNQKIVLDSSFLDIKNVRASDQGSKYSLHPRSEPYGSALEIELEKGVEAGTTVHIDIEVQTTEKCTALQWFDPAQTSNKKHPYMFTQCQAIHARSIIPCQDTPDVKSTFEFNIRSPLPVLASGLSSGVSGFEPGEDGKQGTLLYSFKQNVPMPSYLFALASGDIATASIGPRSLVATGPEELQGAKWELEEDTERFIQAAEKIVYPYAWTTYNVLVLPASFPYGGMENPVFTFATPTIISGDRENVDVIAHELAHSWSGNLVSNASWEHFWLNEGWTVYLERRILASLEGESKRHFSAIIGWKALQDSISFYGPTHPFTKLIVDLKNQDPDDAFSSIPYEKGSTFLWYLEQTVGRTKWDAFIPHYFTTWKYQSLDSFDFKRTLLEFFALDTNASAALNEKVDWEKWFYEPGLPWKPDFDTSLVDICYALATKWESLQIDRRTESTTFEPAADDIKNWTANQLVVFLEKLQLFAKPLQKEAVRAMGEVYNLAASQNIEVVSRYYQVGMMAGSHDVLQPTAKLLGKVGRMKFVRPLYRGLALLDKDLAIETFERHREFYHPICRAAVEGDLFGGKGK
ncbi:MAG: hypothetical protein MMC33_010531 [Icmadophila ericetorum]|nr:hypothetical protein [Icmadophila ericetorum]